MPWHVEYQAIASSWGPIVTIINVIQMFPLKLKLTLVGFGARLRKFSPLKLGKNTFTNRGAAGTRRKNAWLRSSVIVALLRDNAWVGATKIKVTHPKSIKICILKGVASSRGDWCTQKWKAVESRVMKWRKRIRNRGSKILVLMVQ